MNSVVREILKTVAVFAFIVIMLMIMTVVTAGWSFEKISSLVYPVVAIATLLAIIALGALAILLLWRYPRG